jgi:hypothetical protein
MKRLPPHPPNQTPHIKLILGRMLLTIQEISIKSEHLFQKSQSSVDSSLMVVFCLTFDHSLLKL